MKQRKLVQTVALNVVLVVLIFWNQIILSFTPGEAKAFEFMQVAWVGSFLINNGFYFLANVSQKALLKKRFKNDLEN